MGNDHAAAGAVCPMLLTFQKGKTIGAQNY